MKSTNTETRAIENIKKVSLFKKAMERRRRTITAGTKSVGVYITPAVGKWIVIICLSASKPGHRALLDNAVTARNIILDKAQNEMRRPKLVLWKKHEIVSF